MFYDPADEKPPLKKRKSHVIYGRMEPKSEDGGQALICEMPGLDADQMFIRVQSWDETKEHSQIAPYLGQKVKVTIEIIE